MCCTGYLHKTDPHACSLLLEGKPHGWDALVLKLNICCTSLGNTEAINSITVYILWGKKKEKKNTSCCDFKYPSFRLQPIRKPSSDTPTGRDEGGSGYTLFSGFRWIQRNTKRNSMATWTPQEAFYFKSFKKENPSVRCTFLCLQCCSLSRLMTSLSVCPALTYPCPSSQVSTIVQRHRCPVSTACLAGLG